MSIIYQDKNNKKLYKISKEDNNKYMLNEQNLLYVNNTTNEYFCTSTKIFMIVKKQDFDEKYFQITTRTKSYNQEISEKIISKTKF